MRADRWSLTDDATTSPWFQAEWRVVAGTLGARGAGVYQQFPDFDKVLGVSGTPGCSAERAEQVDLGVEQRIGQSARVQVDALRSRGAATCCGAPAPKRGSSTGRVVPASTTATTYENRLEGLARGVELMVQRIDARRLGVVLVRVRAQPLPRHGPGETYWGDLDQRHTMNVYALYRPSPRASFVAKLRIGSNFPVPGYYTRVGRPLLRRRDAEHVRLPSFARLDLRANRTFNWSRRRLTLFAEVINVLNRDNVRFHPPAINVPHAEARQPVRFDAARRSVGGAAD